jgi:hypothetical protein
MVGLFVNLAHRHLSDTGTFPRIQALLSPNTTTSPDEICKLANSINDQITRALLSAEKRCKKPQGEPWSEELHLSSLHVKYWRLKCAATANSYNASTTLAVILPLLPAQYAIVDDGLRTDKQYLNAAKRKLVAYVGMLRAKERRSYRN